MKTIDYLKLLCEQQGPTGFERPVAKIAADAIAPFVDEVQVDTLGSVIAVKRCGLENAKKMLIAAHLDEVGLVVTGHEDGFLCVGQIGGIDPRVLPDRDFVVMTDPPRFGVASVQPPHVLKAEDMEKALKLGDIRIDVGLSQEEAAKEIPIGTPLTYRTTGFEMKNGRYISKTLDDRACFVILLMAAELIKDRKLPWDVYFVGSTGEERGEGGAPAAVFKTGADTCIAIDVTQATTPDAAPDRYAHELGKGPVISIGANITRRIGKRLQELAKKHRIPIQLAAIPGRSGTDAWTMHIVREGVASGIIGLPLRYMHSPTECADMYDMELCAQLVAAFAEEGMEDAEGQMRSETEAQK